MQSLQALTSSRVQFCQLRVSCNHNWFRMHSLTKVDNQYKGRNAEGTNMLRKLLMIVVAAAALGAAVIPNEASARRGHGGWRGGWHGHSWGWRGYGWRPYYSGYAGYGYSCWRWVYTPHGPRRVWVCGYGYPYY